VRLNRNIGYNDSYNQVITWISPCHFIIYHFDLTPLPAAQEVICFLEKIYCMDTKLYVGNLDYATTEEELQDLFGQAGTVKSVVLIKDRETGRSKGFGFVEMDNQAEMQKAISMFQGKRLHERELTVNIARPREERPQGNSSNRGGRDSNRRRY
jgi:hypothetical protein